MSKIGQQHTKFQECADFFETTRWQARIGERCVKVFSEVSNSGEDSDSSGILLSKEKKKNMKQKREKHERRRRGTLF